MNHYVELTNHKLMGGGKIFVCLEDISVLRDHGSDGVGYPSQQRRPRMHRVLRLRLRLTQKGH